MQIREWEKAFRTFSRVVQLQSDDGEAWNNVGSLYIELGQMDQAYVALQEAVKYQRESWRIWENLLTVSLHHGDVYNAVLCVETILELQPQQLDEKAVEHLTTAAIDALRSD
jgi:Flp pilus assembly protein TadD